MSDQSTKPATVEVFIEESAVVRRITVSGRVEGGRGKLGLLYLTGGTDAATLDLYEGIDASGDPLISIAVQAGTTIPVDFRFSYRFQKGLYIKLSGTSPIAGISYFVLP